MGHVRRCFRLDEPSSPENAREVENVDFPQRPSHRFNRFLVSRGRHGLVWDNSSDDSEKIIDDDAVLQELLDELPKKSNSGEKRSAGEKIREDLPPEIEITVEAVVKLSRLARESQQVSPFTLQLKGEMPVGLLPESYCKLIFSLGVDGKDSVMSVCAMKRQARWEFYRKCPFKDCTVSMKFFGKNEETDSIFKVIHMEKKGYCVHFDHRYDDHVATITNPNFHDTKSLLSLVQREANGNHATEYINMKTEVRLRFKANKMINFSTGGNAAGFRLSPKRKLLQQGGSWLKRLRFDDTFADVQFKVGPGLLSIVNAHQCVLAAQSSVFKAKFETQKEEMVEICLPHISAVAMESLLSLVYHSNQTSASNVAMEDPVLVLEVLKLATEYKLQQVMDTCLRSLVQISCSGFTFPVALQMYLAGHQLQLSDLEFKAAQIIDDQKDAMNTAEGAMTMQNFCKDHYQTMPALILRLLALA